MLAGSFQVNRYGMSFGISYIFYRMCGWSTPNSLSAGTSFFFSSAVWITELKFGAAEDIDDASRMRMHWLFFPRFEAVFEHAHLIVFKQHLVILGRKLHWVLGVDGRAKDSQE